MNARYKQPTYTSRVWDFLERADDFVTMKQIIESTGIDLNHVSAALWSFRKVKAADSLESDGKLWWFLTPDSDQRIRKVDERTPELKKRKRRRKIMINVEAQIAVRIQPHEDERLTTYKTTAREIPETGMLEYLMPDAQWHTPDLRGYIIISEKDAAEWNL